MLFSRSTHFESFFVYLQLLLGTLGHARILWGIIINLFYVQDYGNVSEKHELTNTNTLSTFVLSHRDNVSKMYKLSGIVSEYVYLKEQS